MKSSFNILTPVTDTSQCSLLIEVGRQGISYIAYTSDNNCIALSLFHFEASTTNDQVANYLNEIVTEQPLLQRSFNKVNLVYTFPESLLVPDQYVGINTNKEMLELVYGDASDNVIRTDAIANHNLHNVYQVPRQVDSVIMQLFSTAEHGHFYSLLPGIFKGTGNQLDCIFSTTNITVQLLKEGRLQVIQNFQYKVAEDVVYFLLNVCQRFDVDINNTTVKLHGMIDEESNLYNELNKYFLHQEFGSLPEQFIYNEEIKKYPVHYFNHLFELAACV